MKKRQGHRKKMKVRDLNMMALINRSGGKGAHKTKKDEPRATQKVAFKKSLLRDIPPEALAFSPSNRHWAAS